MVKRIVMKHFPFLLLLVLSSCSSESTNPLEKEKTKHPVTVQFFETYSVDDIKDEWLTACKWTSESDIHNLPQTILLEEIHFFGLKQFISSNYNNTIGFAKKQDMTAVDSILAIPEVAKLFPKDLHFMWSMNPQKSILDSSKGYCLYAVKIPSNKKAPVDSRDVKESVPAVNEETEMVNIHVELTKSGKHKLEDLTRKNINRYIVIVLDGKVVSYPKVVEVITEKMRIDENFTMEEAGNISDRMNAGR
jgi:hypothetical protein